MSDQAAKAKFADRIDKLMELAECERQVQAAAHRYEAAEMALVSAAENLQDWSNRWSESREHVLRALPDMLTADALTWYGSGSRLGDANAFIRRYCDDIEARRQAHGWPALTTRADFAAEQETAREQLEREPEIPAGFTKWDSGYCPFDIGAHVEVLTRNCGVWPVTIKPEAPLLWEHEGHDLDIIAYRIIEAAPVADEQDDASEFAEPDALLSALENDHIVERQPFALVDEQTCEPVTPFVEPERPALNADMHDEREQPVTNPEADALAKAHDYYDPRAVAKREAEERKFDPFKIFRHEKEDA